MGLLLPPSWMASPQQEDQLHTSPGLILPLPASIALSPSGFLTVPSPRYLRRSTSPPIPVHIVPVDPDALLIPGEHPGERFQLDTYKFVHNITPAAACHSSVETPRAIPLSARNYMSVYSSSSVDTELSEFSNPPARRYRVPDPSKMPRKITPVRHASDEQS
jgi:hypothetical protein